MITPSANILANYYVSIYIVPQLLLSHFSCRHIITATGAQASTFYELDEGGCL